MSNGFLKCGIILYEEINMRKIIIITILLLICTNLVFAQDNLQRTFIMPPYKGQISGYSDWTIPSDAWAELTNCYVDEQGKIVMRPGFYCWKDSFQDANRMAVIGYSSSANPIVWPGTAGYVVGYDPNQIWIQLGGMIEQGFTDDMTLIITGAKLNNGTYDITEVAASSFYVAESISDGWMGTIWGDLENILGACEYTKQIEGGARAYIIVNFNNKIYWTTRAYGAGNTDISGGLTFSDEGIPQFDTFFNLLFMANGEDNPIMYDQDSNIIQVGRSTYSSGITFEDTNEVVTTNGIHFDTGDYHFRDGMNLIITDSSSNDGTYEIISVDANVIVLKNSNGTAVTLTEEADANAVLIGIGFPDSLSTSRTVNFSQTEYGVCVFEHDYGVNNVERIFTEFNWADYGFRAGMSITVSGSTSNDGTYTIDKMNYGGRPATITVSEDVVDESHVWGSGITFSASTSVTTNGTFDPKSIVGHKGRLFAGGCKEFPTYLFWSRSMYAASYFYDLWRNRFGYDDGTGYYDMQDKIVALVPNFNDMLVVFCEHSIHFLKGDDPGFDILTPNQTLVFQPVPVTKEMGIVGPNAWARVGSDIYFYSQNGLQALSMVAQNKELTSRLISLPIKDLHKTIMDSMLIDKTSFEYIPAMNMLFMLFRGEYSYTLNSLLLCYNLDNNSFSTWEFPYSSEPVCLFEADGFEENPNVVTYIPYRVANPYRTLWYGSEDSKLFAMHKGFAADYDYNDPNDPVINSISMTAITGKLNMGQPFLEKTFQRTVFLCSPQINYSTSSQGAVSFYKKIDDGSWSNTITKSFTQHSDTAGSTIDYYEYLDGGIGFRGTGKTIQYKILTSGTTGRFGLEFVGAMVEWSPLDYRI